MRGRTGMGVAMAAALLVMGAGRLDAAPLLRSDDATLEVRIINNNASAVRVYVEDAEGRQHALGVVMPAAYKALRIPEELTRLGEVEIKVFPAEPAWSSVPADTGVRTRPLSADGITAVQFWVEPDLRRSQIELVRG